MPRNFINWSCKLTLCQRERDGGGGQPPVKSEVRAQSNKVGRLWFFGGRCSRISRGTPEARSRLCVCRASFLMTFVTSGVPLASSRHLTFFLNGFRTCIFQSLPYSAFSNPQDRIRKIARCQPSQYQFRQEISTDSESWMRNWILQSLRASFHKTLRNNKGKKYISLKPVRNHFNQEIKVSTTTNRINQSCMSFNRIISVIFWPQIHNLVYHKESFNKP